MKRQKLKETKGITLVALVITIIVLLILAGVTLSMVLDPDNGLIAKAKQAGTADAEGSAKDAVSLVLADWQVEKYTGKQTLEQFLTSKVPSELEKVTNNGDGTITVETKGYEVTIKEEDSSITNVVKKEETIVVDRTGLKVGDYINYTPDTASAYAKDKLASTISGSSSNSSDITQNTLTWQILKINADGSMDLIGSATSQDIYFQGALGYNNGVYLMNDICKSLYSKSTAGITARSVNLEDFEYWLNKSTSGVAARNSYNNGIATYGDPKQYTGSNSSRPDIFGKTTNESNNYYTTPTTNTYSGGASGDTLDVTQTYYNISINEANYGEGYKALTSSSSAWLASRYVNCNSSYAFFGLRRSSSGIDGYYLFNSGRGTPGSYCRLRPVVSLKSNVQITANDTASTNPNTPHTITQY